MHQMADDVGKQTGKEIRICSLAIIDILTSYASTCAASVLGNAGSVFRSCFRSASCFSSAS